MKKKILTCYCHISSVHIQCISIYHLQFFSIKKIIDRIIKYTNKRDQVKISHGQLITVSDVQVGQKEVQTLHYHGP